MVHASHVSSITMFFFKSTLFLNGIEDVVDSSVALTNV